jgi:hypothetical protein
MLGPLTVLESSFDALLDVASATGARLTWGRTRFTRRYWVAVQFPDGWVRARRARTRAEAAWRLLCDLYAAAGLKTPGVRRWD